MRRLLLQYSFGMGLFKLEFIGNDLFLSIQLWRNNFRTALASKSNWAQIAEWIEQCAKAGVEAARSIVKLDLESNLMTMRLTNPYADEEDSDEMNGNIERSLSNEPINVEIDIGLSADQNVRKYFANRRMAMDKRQKTLAASTKALKSAQLQMNNKFSQVWMLYGFLF